MRIGTFIFPQVQKFRFYRIILSMSISPPLDSILNRFYRLIPEGFGHETVDGSLRRVSL